MKNWPEKLASKTGLKNWTGSGPCESARANRPVRIVPCVSSRAYRPVRIVPGESARAHRIERKMPESQSRLDPNPGFG